MPDYTAVSPNVSSTAVTGRNMPVNEGTSPALWGLATNKVKLVAVYGTNLTVQVTHAPGIPPISGGLPITETPPGSTNGIPINQNTSTNSTYSDPIGFMTDGPIVDAGSASATNWVNQPVTPFPTGSQTPIIQEYAIKAGTNSLGTIRRAIGLHISGSGGTGTNGTISVTNLPP
jgi:hypothetical protein